MLAEAASTDGSDDLQEQSKTLDKTSNSKTNKPKGKADKRKGALEVTRAVSLLPFAGDITFNAKSGTKSSTSLYATEMHATRYQYGFAITPESLREKSRVLDVIDAVVNLTKVGGNQSRFLYQFAPDSVVFRWTDDFAPRILYGFEMDSLGNLSFEAVLEKVKCGDVLPKELFIGGSIVKTLSESDRTSLEGAFLSDSVKAAATKLKDKIKEDLGV
jgi:CRISPR-associated protein Cst2